MIAAGRAVAAVDSTCGRCCCGGCGAASCSCAGAASSTEVSFNHASAAADSGFVSIANNPQEGSKYDGTNALEASYLYRHKGAAAQRGGAGGAEAYFLFVNWFWCCRGVSSTYEIRVGRAAAPRERDPPTHERRDASAEIERRAGGRRHRGSQRARRARHRHAHAAAGDCAPPRAICTTLVPSALTAVGVYRSVVSPKPSWPTVFLPKHLTDLSSSRAHVC